MFKDKILAKAGSHGLIDYSNNTPETKQAFVAFAEDVIDTYLVLKIVPELNKLRKQISQLQKEASDASWVTNPDRMGGAFDPALDTPNDGWK